MSRILAGHFQLQEQVEQARLALIDAGFPDDQVSAFYVNQPGQHDLYAPEPDDENPVGPREVGPRKVGPREAAPRKAGMLVAVALASAADEQRALDVLRGLGADHIEQADGIIVDGDWSDFDPLSLPSLLP